MKKIFFLAVALLLVGAGCTVEGRASETVDTSNWQEYTSKDYGFTLRYPEEFALCLNDFCTEPAEGEALQHVRIGEGSAEVTANPTFVLMPVTEGWFASCKLAADADADAFGRMALANTLESPRNPSSTYKAPEITDITQDAAFNGAPAYAFNTTHKVARCGGGWLAPDDGQYQVMYFSANDQIWQMVTPLTPTFEEIRDSLTFE